MEENARSIIDQAEYQQRYNGLVARYEKAKDRLEKILQQDSALTEFDETLWFGVIDKVTVNATDDIQFTFRDGTVIKA